MTRFDLRVGRDRPPRSGSWLLAGLLVGPEGVVRHRDKFESVATVVTDLDERLVGIGLYHGADRAGLR
jgi:hypothetical protein